MLKIKAVYLVSLGTQKSAKIPQAVGKMIKPFQSMKPKLDMRFFVDLSEIAIGIHINHDFFYREN